MVKSASCSCQVQCPVSKSGGTLLPVIPDSGDQMLFSGLLGHLKAHTHTHKQALTCTHAYTNTYTQISSFLKVTSILNIEMQTHINIATFRMVEEDQ